MLAGTASLLRLSLYCQGMAPVVLMPAQEQKPYQMPINAYIIIVHHSICLNKSTLLEAGVVHLLDVVVKDLLPLGGHLVVEHIPGGLLHTSKLVQLLQSRIYIDCLA